MSGAEASEELESVGQELLDGEKSELDELELGGLPKAKATGMFAGVNNLAQLLFSPVFLQTFVMTFLAEWGDRSQVIFYF
jgi:putative Ca2+/H+ antiporter (TMEM165/GDT1 family)